MMFIIKTRFCKVKSLFFIKNAEKFCFTINFDYFCNFLVNISI